MRHDSATRRPNLGEHPLDLAEVVLGGSGVWGFGKLTGRFSDQGQNRGGLHIGLEGPSVIAPLPSQFPTVIGELIHVEPEAMFLLDRTSWGAQPGTRGDWLPRVVEMGMWGSDFPCCRLRQDYFLGRGLSIR